MEFNSGFKGLNGTHHILVYVDDDNILDGCVHTVMENTEALLVGSKDIGLEVNADKTKCMGMSRDQNAGRSHSIKTDNISFEAVEEFRYVGTLTNQNPIQEENKSRLKSGNAGYHTVQNHCSSCFLSKHLKITIYRTIIFNAVLYGCGTWSLTLREEHKPRMFENRVLRKMFGPKRDGVMRGVEKTT